MKIVKLVAENVKRLHAVSITPEGSLVTVGGKNGAGKSSVLDSISYAMGGEKLVPSEPIRAGEAEAKIVVDLGDLVVTRKFKRSIVDTRTQDDTDETYAAKPKVYGETVSTLVVTNKDGAKYPSPQAVLDKLLGKLTFDPLAFARADPKEQDKILRTLVGIDVTPIEARRKEAFDQRAMLKKTHGIKAAQLMSLPHYHDMPEAEISMDEISKEMLKAEELRKLAEEAERQVESLRTRTEKLVGNRTIAEVKIDTLNKQLADLYAEVKAFDANIEASQRDVDAALVTAQAARAVVPDVAVIRAKVTDTEATNVKVRANQKHSQATLEVSALTDGIALCVKDIEQAEQDKKDALTAAQFPVPGLGLLDDGVTFNSVPFNQAGSAEQVRVSVAIGIALNPQLKVLLIRNGNLLDKDSLAAVAAQAEAASMQVWMEYVSESKDGVAVMLVDGEVV